MIDIETLGTSHNAAIFSIGAAFFDPVTGDIGAEIYIQVDWADGLNNGAVVDPSTLKFWLKQPAEARSELLSNEGERLGEIDALDTLTAFIEKHGVMERVYVWAKSPSFDCSLIRDMFNRIDFVDNAEYLWRFWNERDVRTVEALAKQFNIPLPYKKADVTHHALEDVRGQIRNVSAVISVLHGAAGE
jgi:exodeoxyribonuclease VIII